MKKLVTTLTALVMATGLSMTAQAATKVTTQKTAPVKTATAKQTKAATKAKTVKANHGTTASMVAKTTKSGSSVSAVANKDRATTKTGKKTGEVNIDIPAELKIDENRSNNAASVSAPVAPANPAIMVPVTQVTQTGPATQTTSVQPVTDNTAIASTTTTVPVDVQTVPVVLNP